MTSHKHVHHEVAKKASESLSNRNALERLDRLIAFLDAHFGGVELLPPTTSDDATNKKEEEVEDAKLQLGEESQLSTVPTLKVKLDDKAAYIPIDTMVRFILVPFPCFWLNLYYLQLVRSSSDVLQKRVESIVNLALEISTPLSDMVMLSDSNSLKQEIGPK